MIKFGVAGNSASFYEEGHVSTIEAAKWCKARGIDIFEYSFGRGINLSEKTANDIGKEFESNNVELSVHAPYYINFANTDSEMITKSIGYVLNSLKKLQQFGCGDRLVFHGATQGKLERSVAVATAKDNIQLLSAAIIENNFTDYKVCIETMGKLGQIGTVEEVLQFVNLAPFFYPCIDFGHLNARTFGAIKTADDYEAIIKYMLDNTDSYKVKNMHIHFSKIEYGKSGEIRHLTFEDEIYGPDFLPLAEMLHKYQLTPTIICESDGTQAEDAITMKNNYYSLIQ